jgi:electron transfer flavoprotein alpha subunit
VNVLVYLEDHDGQVSSGSLGVLSKAAEVVDGPVAGVVIGGSASDLAAQAERYGAQRLYAASGEGLEAPLPQPRVDVLASVVEEGAFDTVLFSNSVLAADVAAGLAARLEAGLNWDLTDVADRSGTLVGTRMALGDSVLVEVGWNSAIRLALMRAGSFDLVERPVQAEVVELTPVLGAFSAQARIVETRPAIDEGPVLEGADVVVTGGVGLGAKENFALAEELAAVLGGVVGATRAAVYAGWYPHSAQIGQTGKTVAPALYVALGVSGAVQHKVGMQRAKTIISINTDAAAPIFEFSDLSVVGDVHVIVPRLIELVRERKGS